MKEEAEEAARKVEEDRKVREEVEEAARKAAERLTHLEADEAKHADKWEKAEAEVYVDVNQSQILCKKKAFLPLWGLEQGAQRNKTMFLFFIL